MSLSSFHKHVLLEGVVPYAENVCYVFCITLNFSYMCDVQHGFALLAYNAHSSNMIPCSCPDVEPSRKYLPQMIGDKLPTEDGKWECFFLLHDILQLCTARVSSSALTGLPDDHHHTLFIQCYPHLSVTPKIQYMVHFPYQIAWLLHVFKLAS